MAAPAAVALALATAKARGRWIALGVGIAAMLIPSILAWGVYSSQVAPFRKPVIVVDRQALPMGYLIARLTVSDAQPLDMLDVLVREQVMAIEAARPPFSIIVTDEDVDAHLRHVAESAGDTLTDKAYRVWRRQVVTDSGMSRADYLQTLRMQILRARMADRLGAARAASAPQVHVHMLAVTTLEEAEQLRASLNAGEDFSRRAQQVSIDPQLRALQGDMGWMPRAALPAPVAEVAFDRLPVGEVSPPLARVDHAGWLLVKVSERSDARPVSAFAARQVGLRRLDDWVDQAYTRHVIALIGIAGGGYDSATNTWVLKQVAKRRELRGR